MTKALTNPFDADVEENCHFDELTDLFADERKFRPFIDVWTPECNCSFETPTPPLPPYGIDPLPHTSLLPEAQTTDRDEDEYSVEDNVARYRVRSRGQLERLRFQLKPKGDMTQRAECFFIRQQNSHSRLLTSRNLFEAWACLWCPFRYIQDHLMSFGFKVREDDIGPPRCRVRSRAMRKDGAAGGRADSLETSSFKECVYGLRYVEKSGGSNSQGEWRVRQSAIYQKTDPESNRETWLLVSASEKMQERVHKYLSAMHSLGPPEPADLHTALITIAGQNWRWYLRSLVAQVTEQTSRVVAASVDEETETSLFDFQISFEDRQKLKMIEDKILDLLVIFDTMTDTIRELCHQWTGTDDPCKSTRRSQSNVYVVLQDNIAEISLHRHKAQTLLARLSGTTALLSNLLDTQVGRSLQTLAEESRKENQIMRQLTEKSTKDAAAVKAITIITIIYLPTSVVASFFSTQFVYQDTDASGKPSLNIADDWWLYVAISVPLTIATIAIWYAWISWPWYSVRPWQRRAVSARAVKTPSELGKLVYLQSTGRKLSSRNQMASLRLSSRRSHSNCPEAMSANAEQSYNCV